MPTYDGHGYPIFRTCVTGVVADHPRQPAEIEEAAVMEALNAPLRTALANGYELALLTWRQGV